MISIRLEAYLCLLEERLVGSRHFQMVVIALMRAGVVAAITIVGFKLCQDGGHVHLVRIDFI